MILEIIYYNSQLLEDNFYRPPLRASSGRDLGYRGERAIYTTQNYHTDDFWPFQHLEMAVPVTELIPQQFSYFERGSAHTLELRSIYPLKDNRRGAMEKKLVYIVYSCHTGDFGPWARFRHMAGQKN